MGFLGVYTAVYDYQPQGEGELEIKEGDLLYVLDKNSDDDWWKAKKKAERDDEDEPEGLVPNNYVEEAQPVHQAKALFDYTRQTDEEVSFSEDSEILVYDTSDPDWTLVGVGAEYGFAPANYIEIVGDATPTAGTTAVPPSPPSAAEPAPPSLPTRPTQPAPEEYEETPSPSPIDTLQNPAAAAIANIIHQQHAPPSAQPEPTRDEPSPPRLPTRPSHEQEEVREESPPPALPRRPPSEQFTPPMPQYDPDPSPPPPRPSQPAPPMGGNSRHYVKESPPYNRAGEMTPRSPSGYHIYNINEMVEVMGKRKKMPTTLGINMVTGIIFISPEGDDRQQEWTAEKLTHYSIEGKHVFVDLVRPSKSIDFHAGAKDTAQEIVAALGEIAGAYRAEGLREVIAAGEGGGAQKKGQILYDFMAQGDDEVTVAVGDEVAIIDDTKAEEWWMVRRLKNGKEGVVPSSYVEITGFMPLIPTPVVDTGISSVERNRLEEARLAKAAIGKTRTDSMDSSERKRDSKRDSKSAKSKPDPSKVRKWTDRSKAFTVEAQYIGLLDGKIQLHKVNGIKIAVPIAKMSVEDLEYVEKVAGVSLDEDKPLSSIRARGTSDSKRGSAGASVQRPEYDWFDFFLKSGVGPHQCERYAQNFIKDSMDESVLPDITPETLRTLGLKEGDILRVMRHLDTTLGRTGAKSKLRNVSFGGEEVIGNGEEGGLFAGPGGMLRNNTRKGRPAPAVQAGDVVDPKAFEQADESKPKAEERASTPPAPAAPEKPVARGFDDDAWEVKKPKESAAAAALPSGTASPPPAQPPIQKQVTGALADLSLLQAPLQPNAAQPTPTPAVSTIPALQPQQTAVQSPPVQPQQTGATPNFFTQIAQIGQHQQQQQAQAFSPQQTGFQAQARQRPQAPQNMAQNSLLPPPPQRPLSAPQNFMQQQNSFGPPPLQPQLTGVPQPGPALPGQSLTELNQQRLQPQIQMQPQVTGFMGQNQYQNGMMIPQPTGFTPQSQFGIQQQQQNQLPYTNGQPGFQGMAPQATGFGGFAPPQQPMQTGINSMLPPALQPQQTGANGFGTNAYSINNPPPVPPIPQQPTATPLSPQKTGPPPSIRFGVKPDAPKKLAPQPTGLRANLSQATPNNPFGF
ncbi:Actin cytoskeleton-regulatory complex protein sla1 [Penicillium subrubescens]|uniref:Actin cytoskeleton-regulatory complex protein SLA1 n=1 Tax=Penicillium subrubescens TaxID=1316194 RepID=A0A1Q5SMI2_9EURO|nr:Actin cytoskeleton-regulatory complex protein sla1 [Penicillium subrubescens]KAJ5875505.1 Actin cytoskeleton-regulatory complex protein sla1 [Penicillium subrubescens]OKO89208.1 Actin cytoskeleton-regulatory complex protein sla1 [Penicillium subrubescens]